MLTLYIIRYIIYLSKTYRKGEEMIFPMNTPMFDLLVLAVVDKEDSYGYQISQVIKQVSNTKDSTLYPVLRRLQEQNYLTAYDQPYQGRNRKYYRITDEGKQTFEMLSKEWSLYKDAVDQVVKGGMDIE